MARNPYFNILFEPVKIGHVTTKNRFYQVPHCSGMGYKMPNSLAGMRGMKAEGGWSEKIEGGVSGVKTPATQLTGMMGGSDLVNNQEHIR